MHILRTGMRSNLDVVRSRIQMSYSAIIERMENVVERFLISNFVHEYVFTLHLQGT